MSPEATLVAEVLRAALRLLDLLPPPERKTVAEQLGLADEILARVPAGSVSDAVERVIADARDLPPVLAWSEPTDPND